MYSREAHVYGTLSRMGVYKRPDSKFYWLCLERKGAPAIREATRIPKADENRAAAERLYSRRMVQLVKNPTSPKRPERGAGWCYIYFIQSPTGIKIGRAGNLQDRLSALNTSCADELKVLLAVPAHASVERAIHRRFYCLRIKGEWFHAAPELLQFIDEAKTSGRDIAEIICDPLPVIRA